MDFIGGSKAETGVPILLTCQQALPPTYLTLLSTRGRERGDSQGRKGQTCLNVHWAGKTVPNLLPAHPPVSNSFEPLSVTVLLL